jgi:excinuclease ABC subunit C
VKRLRAATAAEIAEVPGVGRRTAEAVVMVLSGNEPAPAVDPSTGEILDPREASAVEVAGSGMTS